MATAKEGADKRLGNRHCSIVSKAPLCCDDREDADADGYGKDEAPHLLRNFVSEGTDVSKPFNLVRTKRVERWATLQHCRIFAHHVQCLLLAHHTKQHVLARQHCVTKRIRRIDNLRVVEHRLSRKCLRAIASEQSTPKSLKFWPSVLLLKLLCYGQNVRRQPPSTHLWSCACNARHFVCLIDLFHSVP